MLFGWPFVVARRRGGRVHLLRSAGWDAQRKESMWLSACGLSMPCTATSEPPPGRRRCRSCDRVAEDAHQRWMRSGKYPR